jgi:mutator family transposase
MSFDEKILSMYARGMTPREIQGHLQEIYGVEVSPSLISEGTDAVIEEVKAWQSPPLEPLYPMVFLDALMGEDAARGRVRNRARCTWPLGSIWRAQGRVRAVDLGQLETDRSPRLETVTKLGRPSGTSIAFPTFPALKRWAIKRPPLRGWGSCQCHPTGRMGP